MVPRCVKTGDTSTGGGLFSCVAAATKNGKFMFTQTKTNVRSSLVLLCNLIGYMALTGSLPTEIGMLTKLRLLALRKLPKVAIMHCVISHQSPIAFITHGKTLLL